jgi:hypothetical protein
MRPGLRAGHAVKLAEVCQLLGQSHLRIQAALLGHVADPPARREIERLAVPAHLALVGAEHPEHDPHRRGLARAVAADEAEQFAGMDVEAQVLYGDSLPVSFRDPSISRRRSVLMSSPMRLPRVRMSNSSRSLPRGY